MSAIILLLIFGLLILAPALAACSLRMRVAARPASLSRTEKRILEFPLRRKAEHSKYHKETDAA